MPFGRAVGDDVVRDETERAVAAPAPAVVAAPPPAPRLLGAIGKPYTIAKVGTFLPSGDLADLNEGFAGELVFGRSLLSFLAIEGSLGLISTDGRFGATQLDFWAVPAFVNARVGFPILALEPYAGVGVGGMYANYEVGSFSESDWVTAWDAFVGLEVGIGRLAVGAEYKYLQSDDTKNNFAIEGSSATLFVSVPF